MFYPSQENLHYVSAVSSVFSPSQDNIPYATTVSTVFSASRDNLHYVIADSTVFSPSQDNLHYITAVCTVCPWPSLTMVSCEIPISQKSHTSPDITVHKSALLQEWHHDKTRMTSHKRLQNLTNTTLFGIEFVFFVQKLFHNKNQVRPGIRPSP